jgi:CTP synthase (UTP-ammonia lyase)
VVLIGVIGDFDPELEPHAAITPAVQEAATSLGVEAAVRWIETPEAETLALEGFNALWCAPGGPYRSIDGALRAIGFAREHDVPFLGTCGGFQHAVIEYARNVLGRSGAQHAEYDPGASDLFVTELSCSLVGQTMSVRLEPGSKAAEAYGREETSERYYCSFGLNRERRDELHEAGLRVSGTDEDGEVRVMEIPDLRFFVATLFVPQVRSAHPLIAAYVGAAAGVPAANASAASRSNSP